MKRFIKAVQRLQLWRWAVVSVWVPIHAAIWKRMQETRAYAFQDKGGVIDFPTQRLPSTDLARQVCAEILAFAQNSTAFDDAKQTCAVSASRDAFTTDVTVFLPVDIRRKIVGLALEADVLDWVVRYFGFAPRLHDVILALSFPTPGLGEEGSKRWHRDGGDADGKHIKLFIPVTPIDQRNGPFYYFEKPDLDYHAHLSQDDTPYADRWLRGRVSNDVIESVATNTGGEIRSLVNSDSGERLLIDTLTVYHKGGWCQERDRLMLQLCFRARGYSSGNCQDFGEVMELSPAEMRLAFPQELHRFVLGVDEPLKTNPLVIVGKWLLFRLNRSLFTYPYVGRSRPSPRPD